MLKRGLPIKKGIPLYWQNIRNQTVKYLLLQRVNVKAVLSTNDFNQIWNKINWKGSLATKQVVTDGLNAC